MTREDKQAFTRRIAKANRSQLAVIVYEMFLVYLEDAKKAHAAENKAEFARSLELARGCVQELRASLNFEYDIAKYLFDIYCFADRKLAQCIFSGSMENIDAIAEMFTKLRNAYAEISAQDKTEPLMDNIQDVYAGYTYGKNDINESLVNYDAGRGYRA